MSDQAHLPGIDLAGLASWMDDQHLGNAPLRDVAPLSGGTQNVMARFTRDSRGFVLRRGPLHLRPRSNDVIRREMRILGALEGTPVPRPVLVAGCDDETVMDGAVFYLMEPLDGFNAGIELPALHAEDEGVRHTMGLSVVDALAALHAVDHVAVGLGDYGKPEGFLERQVGRWLSELASYDSFADYPGPAIGDVQGIAAWLGDNLPKQWSPGILHGDYHLANVMFSRTGPDVVAIVDWEMSTIGDPLLDLGWLLATWELPGAPDEFAGKLTRAGGLASHDELVARYAQRSSRDLSAIDWYVVLACFKLGIVLEGSYARALSGLAPMEIGERLRHTTLRLFERAANLIEDTP